eukprot:Lithocolla_globosa_v1_NODE_337_length_4409_cov_50.992421.p1 type:complete len:855 gc:universal NODE_337_length_4409_cov_50.992421:3132-568(-)
MNIFTPIAHKHIPIKTRTNRQTKTSTGKPWVTPELKKQIKKQHKLFEKHKKNMNDQNLKQEHRTHKNKTQKELQKAKKSYYHNLFNEHIHNAKKTWSIISNILTNCNNKQSFPKKINVKQDDGSEKIVTDKKEIANTFNTFFTTVASNLVKKIKEQQELENGTKISFKEYVKRNTTSSFQFTKTNNNTVKNLLQKLDVSKAIGVDHIHTITLVDSADIIAQYITYIFNLCLKHGVFPDKLKLARVTPLYKKGNPFIESNYRPVSILNTLSKIFERQMLDQIMTFLVDNNIISKSQYGFLKKSSTSTALINFYEDLLHILDEKGMMGLGTLIDLAKAFDTVNHEILLDKLEIYGFGETSLALIKSYLSNRTQIVIIDKTESDPMEITCGVPQGSILGPLFFILYINDLPNALNHSQALMFADDTTILNTNQNIHTLRENTLMDLSSTSKWCRANLLTLNESKTAYLLFSGANKQLPDSFPIDNLPKDPPQTTTMKITKEKKREGNSTTCTTTFTESTKVTQSIMREIITQEVTTSSPESIETIKTEPYTITTNTNPLNLTINGNHICMEEKTKFLGLMINENLKWKDHVQSIVKKICKYVGIFSKLRYYIPRKMLLNLYYAFIYSHFIYCLEIWGSSDTNITYLQPLLIIQKKLVRIMTDSAFLTHATPLFKKLQIMNIFDLFKYRIAILAYKYINSDTKIRLKKVSFVKNQHNYNTKSSIHGKIFMVHYRTKTYGKQTISNKITNSWNSLPSTLTTLKSFNSFKYGLREFILLNPSSYVTYCDSSDTYRTNFHKIAKRDQPSLKKKTSYKKAVKKMGVHILHTLNSIGMKNFLQEYDISKIPIHVLAHNKINLL